MTHSFNFLTFSMLSPSRRSIASNKLILVQNQPLSEVYLQTTLFPTLVKTPATNNLAFSASVRGWLKTDSRNRWRIWRTGKYTPSFLSFGKVSGFLNCSFDNRASRASTEVSKTWLVSSLPGGWLRPCTVCCVSEIRSQGSYSHPGHTNTD